MQYRKLTLDWLDPKHLLRLARIQPIGSRALWAGGFSAIETLVGKTFGHLHNFAMVDRLN